MELVTLILISPALPFPDVLVDISALSLTYKDPALILTVPVSLDFPVDSTLLNMPLFTPETCTLPRTVMSTFPTSAIPDVLVETLAPFRIDKDSASILILPNPLPLTTTPGFTILNTPLFAPDNKTAPSAIILTSPAYPSPDVLADNPAPSLTDRDPVLIVTMPPLPTAPVSTVLLTTLFMPEASNLPVALILIFPAFPFPKVLLAKKDSPRSSSVLVKIFTLPAFPSAVFAT